MAYVLRKDDLRRFCKISERWYDEQGTSDARELAERAWRDERYMFIIEMALYLMDRSQRITFACECASGALALDASRLVREAVDAAWRCRENDSDEAREQARRAAFAAGLAGDVLEEVGYAAKCAALVAALPEEDSIYAFYAAIAATRASVLAERALTERAAHPILAWEVPYTAYKPAAEAALAMLGIHVGRDEEEA